MKPQLYDIENLAEIDRHRQGENKFESICQYKLWNNLLQETKKKNKHENNKVIGTNIPYRYIDIEKRYTVIIKNIRSRYFNQF